MVSPKRLSFSLRSNWTDSTSYVKFRQRRPTVPARSFAPRADRSGVEEEVAEDVPGVSWVGTPGALASDMGMFFPSLDIFVGVG